MNGRPSTKVFFISLQIKNQFRFPSSGQKIPPGLHVRLNLETGLREAKLLDKDEQKSSSNDIIAVSSGE
jgi:nucleotide exchange factor SIL1